MATFLEIAQDVARESGTIPSQTVTSVVGQDGRLLNVAAWVRDAWTQIQVSRNWSWMLHEFTGPTILNTGIYDSGQLGATRFGEWDNSRHPDEDSFSIYLTSGDRHDENGLTFLHWDEFRRQALFGAAAVTQNRPGYISIDPQERLRLWPLPDADYTLRGQYYKAPQILTQNEDIPEMPAKFHAAIKWHALLYLGVFDEAPTQIPQWSQFLQAVMTPLEEQQLPEIRLFGALA